jgi:hypothetical protein
VPNASQSVRTAAPIRLVSVASDSLRGEVGAGVHRPRVRAERQRGRVTADAFRGKAVGHLGPQAGIDEQAVHEHDRRAVTRGRARGAVGELALR